MCSRRSRREHPLPQTPNPFVPLRVPRRAARGAHPRRPPTPAPSGSDPVPRGRRAPQLRTTHSDGAAGTGKEPRRNPPQPRQRRLGPGQQQRPLPGTPWPPHLRAGGQHPGRACPPGLRPHRLHRRGRGFAVGPVRPRGGVRPNRSCPRPLGPRPRCLPGKARRSGPVPLRPPSAPRRSWQSPPGARDGAGRDVSRVGSAFHGAFRLRGSSELRTPPGKARGTPSPPLPSPPLCAGDNEWPTRSCPAPSPESAQPGRAHGGHGDSRHRGRLSRCRLQGRGRGRCRPARPRPPLLFRGARPPPALSLRRARGEQLQPARPAGTRPASSPGTCSGRSGRRTEERREAAEAAPLAVSAGAGGGPAVSAGPGQARRG